MGNNMLTKLGITFLFPTMFDMSFIHQCFKIISLIPSINNLSSLRYLLD